MRPDSMLVIGYGNDLRGDDAAGPVTAAAVAAWRLPHVRALAQHQLTPELAEPLSRTDRAVFLDAHGALESGTARLIPLQADSGGGSGGHTADPSSLLALARTAYGRVPEAWLLAIPAASFRLGASLSPTAERGIAEALALLRPFLESPDIRQPDSTDAAVVRASTGDVSTAI